ncbi:hypothetical protein TWF679_001491, partial [Orbilia oligospora]
MYASTKAGDFGSSLDAGAEGQIDLGGISPSGDTEIETRSGQEETRPSFADGSFKLLFAADDMQAVARSPRPWSVQPILDDDDEGIQWHVAGRMMRCFK